MHDALAVADELADEFSIEVLDPRTLYPFDWELLAESLGRTGRLVVFDDANRSCGFAAEIVATAAEEMALARAAAARHARGRADLATPSSSSSPRCPAANGWRRSSVTS